MSQDQIQDLVKKMPTDVEVLRHNLMMICVLFDLLPHMQLDPETMNMMKQQYKVMKNAAEYSAYQLQQMELNWEGALSAVTTH